MQISGISGAAASTAGNATLNPPTSRSASAAVAPVLAPDSLPVTAAPDDTSTAAVANGTSSASRAATANTTAPASATPAKSLVYGALGLQSPTDPTASSDGYYTAGKWLAAAVTVGGIISLFV